MEYKIQDLIDIHLFQSLQDKLNEIYSFPSAILDKEGNILTATAWQDVCTKFHRVNPKSEPECRKSDQYINEHLHEACPAVTYDCPLGLCDSATPIIIDGKHVGAFFTGQFFLKKPDIQFFIKQAKQYGFEEKAYLEAVSKVPIWSEERLHKYLSVIKAITEILAKIGHENLKNIEERKIIEENLAELRRMEFTLHKSENRFKQIAENSSDFIWEIDANGLYTYCNKNILKILGYSSDEVVGQKYFYDFFVPDIREELKAAVFQAFERKEPFRNFINLSIHKNGQTVLLETSGSPILDDERNLIGYCGADTDITETKKVEQELQHSHETFKNYFELGSVGMCVTSPEKNWIEVNPRLCQMFGYSKEEIKQCTWADLTHPDDLAADVELFDQVLLGERNSYDLDKRFIRKDGSILYTTLSVTCQRKEDGTVDHFLASLIDITDRKLAEQDYQIEKAFMDKLFDSSPEAISVSDEKGFLVRVNTKFLKLFGFEKEEVIGRRIDDLIAHGIYHDEGVKITNAAHSGRTIELESIRYRKDGTPLHVSIVATPITVGELFIGGYGIYRDITIRKRSEKALKESEELYRNLIEMIPDGIYKSTSDGKFIEVNPAMVKMLGYKNREELLTIDIKKQLYFQENDRYSKEQEKKPEALRIFRLRKKDGSELWVEDNCRYIKDEQGNITYHEGILRDITQIRNVEIQLAKQTTELKELNATKDKFFSIIAHDLKNPFNTILGFTDLLITDFHEFDTEAILRTLNNIANSSKQTYALLENLLLWARTQTETIDYQPEEINLQSIVLEVIGLIENQAKKKNIIISSGIMDHSNVNADKNMIETIIRNLFTNAIKFTPKNGDIVVSTVKRNDYIEISIRDSGIGIDKKDMDNVFRIDSKTSTLGTEKEKGSGLGLILCKEFVEKHGGKIWVESKPGHGSTFKFTIPLSK